MIDFLNASEAAALGLDLPDVYYRPEYAASAEVIDAGTWECAVADGGRLYFPYLRRPVPGHPDLYDVVSPYGYTAPVAPGAAERAAFVAQVRAAGRERGLVAEFLRSHPFDIADPATDGLAVDRSRAHPTFTVDLRDGVDAYWDAAEGRHRTAVRKAEKSGVTVAEQDVATVLSSDSGFRRLYDETMARVGSSSRLKLPDEYYARLLEGLGSDVQLFEARIDDEPVAASLFLRSGSRLHYHLSGSTDAGMRLGATNALIDFAIRAHAGEVELLHLGGGVSAGDGLERFKRSIGRMATTVHLCQTVVDRQRYDALVEEAGADPDTSYFPAYRA